MTSGTRALILGGGGPVGIAWEAGVLTALADAGIDFTRADRVVGTSAGSVVGALLTLGLAPKQIAELWGRAPERVPEARQRAASGKALDGAALFQAMQQAMRGERSAAEIAADLGRVALAAPTVSEDKFFEVFQAVRDAAEGAAWPPSFVCTAFDAETGEFKRWDAEAGATVELPRAVATSCAVPGVYPPMSVDGRRYIDGGLLSPTNAQLAAGCERVLVLSVTEFFLAAAARGAKSESVLERELAGLREGGSRSEVIQLEGDAARELAPQLLNVHYQPQGLAAGLEQGRAAAERVRALWN